MEKPDTFDRAGLWDRHRYMAVSYVGVISWGRVPLFPFMCLSAHCGPAPLHAKAPDDAEACA